MLPLPLASAVRFLLMFYTDHQGRKVVSGACKILFLICFCFHAPSAWAYSEEVIEDLIDVFESKNKVVAVIEGKRTITFNLRLKERVLCSDAKGYMGAFLINEHFLSITTSSNAWHALPLKRGESEKTVVSLSPYLVLLATRDRAIAFDAAANRFVETRLPIHDELLEAAAEKYIAVVITSSRAFGFATEASAFSEIRLKLRETINAVKITSSKATIRTSDRLITFEAIGAAWKVHKLP